MNKILLEYAEQAGFYVEGDKVFCDSFNSIHELLENYAELIIEKCGEIADDHSEHGILSSPIDRYFGV